MIYDTHIIEAIYIEIRAPNFRMYILETPQTAGLKQKILEIVLNIDTFPISDVRSADADVRLVF